MMELRKKRLQERLKNITNPEQRQAALDAVARLDCYVQSLRQRFMDAGDPILPERRCEVMVNFSPVDERVDLVKKIEIIQVCVCKGRGTQDALYRRVEKFYKVDGTFIGQIDPLEGKCKQGMSPKVKEADIEAFAEELKSLLLNAPHKEICDVVIRVCSKLENQFEAETLTYDSVFEVLNEDLKKKIKLLTIKYLIDSSK